MSRGTVVYLAFFLLSVFQQGSEEFSLFKKRKEKAFRFRELSPFPNSENLDCTLYNTSIQMLSRGATALSCQAAVRKNIERVTEMGLTVKRCSSFSEPETCEFYTKYMFRQICKAMVSDTFSFIMKLVSPEEYRRCPWPKGTITVSNATIAPNKFIESFFPGFSEHYWRIIGRLYNGKKIILCGLIGFDIIEMTSEN